MARNATKTCSHRCANLLLGCAQMHTKEAVAKRAEKMKGENNPAWNGGKYIEPGKGYVMVHNPTHPRARVNGYVLEHILVAETMMGRPLAPGEEVHHINRKRDDNRPENLQVFRSHLEHWMQEHYEDVARARDAASSRRSSPVLEPG